MIKTYFEIDCEKFVYLKLYCETVYIDRKDITTIDELSLFISERIEEPNKFNLNIISKRIIDEINKIEKMSNYDRHMLFINPLTLIKYNLTDIEH